MHEKKLWKQSRIFKQIQSKCTQYLRHLHNPCDEDISSKYVLQKKTQESSAFFPKKKSWIQKEKLG
jgi:hypothetical protein